MSPLIVFILIVAIRTLTVTFGYLRSIHELQRKLAIGFIFGIIEVSLWLMIIVLALEHIRQDPTYAVLYAFGFALGNVLGLLLEKWIPLGNAEIILFAPPELDLASIIHENGLAATKMKGFGRDGEVDVIYSFIMKKELKRLLRILPKDDRIFYTLDYGYRVSKISKFM